MQMYEIYCPLCGNFINRRLPLMNSMNALSCGNCHIRSDIKVNPDSQKTGEYTVTNVRKF